MLSASSQEERVVKVEARVARDRRQPTPTADACRPDRGEGAGFQPEGRPRPLRVPDPTPAREPTS